MVHGREMFTKQLDEYLELESTSSELLLPPSPGKSPGRTNPARHLQFSSEHKVETPTSYFSSDDKNLASDSTPVQTQSAVMPPPTPPEPAASKVDTPEEFLEMSESAKALIDSVTPLEPVASKVDPPEEFLEMSESAKALIDFVTGGITEVVAEETSGDMSGAETDDDFDPIAYESGGDNSFERSASFDAAAYIEMACDGMASPRSPAEDSSDYMDAAVLLDEEANKHNNMSEGAKALIESLLVFSEDGMDEIANHIESNRNEDQLAEEQIENFIDDVADQAIGACVHQLELHADEAAGAYKPYV